MTEIAPLPSGRGLQECRRLAMSGTNDLGLWVRGTESLFHILSPHPQPFSLREKGVNRVNGKYAITL
jgi:hypothetical protein